MTLACYLKSNHHTKKISLAICFSILLGGLVIHSANASTLRIAVASNFTHTMKSIVKRYHEKTAQRVLISSGSTGKHFAQIMNGAPFDIFFAADKRRPEIIENNNIVQPGNRFTYAIGQLVLWSAKIQDRHLNLSIFNNFTNKYLAIANPKLAPYGKAAEETLKKINAWSRIRKNIVMGENITQAFQFAASGNAALAMLAYSQVKQANANGQYYLIPKNHYTPIEQQAVILKNNKNVQSFVSFFKSKKSQDLILNAGYRLP